MIRAWTPQDIRDAEAPLLDAGLGEALMARASAALAMVCVRELRVRTGSVYGRRALLLVGKGNNGGDTLYAGRRLAERGVHVDVVLTAGEAHPDGLSAARAAGVRIHELTAEIEPALHLLRTADLVVDGIVGTGARAGLRSPVRELVAAWTDDPAPKPAVVAVDVPSGIDAATGDASPPCIRADVTLTFAGAKPGLLLPPAAQYAGAVEVADIGIPVGVDCAAARITPSDISRMWQVPGTGDHKYTRGVLGVVAGSTRYPGAAVLATGGARASGVGMIRYVGPAAVAGAVNTAYPEIVPGSGRVQAWLLGPGIDPADDERMDDVRRCLRDAGDTQIPCIVDAGALAAVQPAEQQTGQQAGQQADRHAEPRSDPPMILTPHAGELATLLTRLEGEDVTRTAIEAAPATWAQRAARAADAVVVLKGAVTVIAAPSGPVYAQADGPPWLATAGAGDVLAGIIGAITATSSESPTGKSLQALARYASLGVMVHGLAATQASGGGPIAAADISAALPAVLADHLSPAAHPAAARRRVL